MLYLQLTFTINVTAWETELQTFVSTL